MDTHTENESCGPESGIETGNEYADMGERLAR